MLSGILLAVLILVSIALAAVVLLQRSEGGALGMGGGPSGFMTTRGAGDLLTRTTWILAAAFFSLCLLLTIVQGRAHHGGSVVDRLKVDPLNADTLNLSRPVAPAPTPGAPANAATGFEAPAPQVNSAVAPAAIAPVAGAPADTGTLRPVRSPPTEAPTSPRQASTAAAPTPTVQVTPADRPHAATTPPDTGSGPVNPVAGTVGGLPAPVAAPAPRSH